MNSKILLINFDSTIPNLALEKVRIYYQNKGYEVLLKTPEYFKNEEIKSFA